MTKRRLHLYIFDDKRHPYRDGLYQDIGINGVVYEYKSMFLKAYKRYLDSHSKWQLCGAEGLNPIPV